MGNSSSGHESGSRSSPETARAAGSGQQRRRRGSHDTPQGGPSAPQPSSSSSSPPQQPCGPRATTSVSHLSLPGTGAPGRRHPHKDAAAGGAMTVSSMTQGSHLVSPVTPVRHSDWRSPSPPLMGAASESRVADRLPPPQQQQQQQQQHTQTPEGGGGGTDVDHGDAASASSTTRPPAAAAAASSALSRRPSTAAPPAPPSHGRSASASSALRSPSVASGSAAGQRPCSTGSGGSRRAASGTAPAAGDTRGSNGRSSGGSGTFWQRHSRLFLWQRRGARSGSRTTASPSPSRPEAAAALDDDRDAGRPASATHDDAGGRSSGSRAAAGIRTAGLPPPVPSHAPLSTAVVAVETGATSEAAGAEELREPHPAARAGSTASDATTSTDTNSAPILPPPPTGSLADAMWGVRRPPLAPTTPTSTANHSISMAVMVGTDHDSDDVGDREDGDGAPTTLQHPASPHPPPQRLHKALGILVSGPLSTTTVTDTTARVSPHSPAASPLSIAAAEAESSNPAASAAAAAAAAASSSPTSPSTVATTAAVPPRATTPPAKGRRTINQLAIIAAWNRMGARASAFAGSGGPADAAAAAAAATSAVESPAATGAVVPVRRRSAVALRQRGPPPQFFADARATTAAAVPVAETPPSVELSRASGGDAVAGDAAQESPQPPPLDMRATTSSSAAPTCRESDASNTAVQQPTPLAERKRDEVGEEDTTSATATASTVDADEERGGAAGHGGLPPPRKWPLVLPPPPPPEAPLRRRVSASGFTATHITVAVTDTATGALLPRGSVPSVTPHVPRSRRLTSSSALLASQTGAATPFGVIAWVHSSSPSSPRSHSTSDSRLEAAASAEEDGGEDGDADLHDGDGDGDGGGGGVFPPPVRRSDVRLTQRVAGRAATPPSRRLRSPPPLLTSRSDSGGGGYPAAAAARALGDRDAHPTIVTRSNSCQPTRRHPRQTPEHFTMSASAAAAAARFVPPRWRERLTPTPLASSPLSLSIGNEDVFSGPASVLCGQHTSASQGMQSPAGQAGLLLRWVPPPPPAAATATSPSRLPQPLRRRSVGGQGSAQWREVSGGGNGSGRRGGGGGDDGVHHCTSPIFGVIGVGSSSGSSGSSAEAGEGSAHFLSRDCEDDVDVVVNGVDAAGAASAAFVDSGDGGGGGGALRLDECGAVVSDRASDDDDDTVLWWGSSAAPTWGEATPPTWQHGNADADGNASDEEGEEVDGDGDGVSGGRGGESSRGGHHRLQPRRHLRRLVQRRRRHSQRRSLSPPSPCTPQRAQPLTQDAVFTTTASRDAVLGTPSEQSVPHTRSYTRTYADSVPRLPQTRYEPPMPSNRNTFTAFVDLSDISSSQLLATAAAAAAFQRRRAAHPCEALPVPHAFDPAAPPGGLQLDGHTLPEVYLADGGGLSAESLAAAGAGAGAGAGGAGGAGGAAGAGLGGAAGVVAGVLPTSPLYSSLSTAPTNHVSRADTPVLGHVRGSSAMKHWRNSDAPRYAAPAPSGYCGAAAVPHRDLARAVPVADGVASIDTDGSSRSSEEVSLAAAQPALTSRQASWSLESVRVTTAAAAGAAGAPAPLTVPSEGEDEGRPLGGLLRFSSSSHSAASASAAVAAAAPVPLSSAPLSASQPLPGQQQQQAGQPWWNRRRPNTHSEGSGTLEVSQRGGESGNSAGGQSPYSPRSADSALAMGQRPRGALWTGVAPGGDSPSSPPPPAPVVSVTGDDAAEHTTHTPALAVDDRHGRRSRSHQGCSGGSASRDLSEAAGRRAHHGGDAAIKRVRSYDTPDRSLEADVGVDGDGCSIRNSAGGGVHASLSSGAIPPVSAMRLGLDGGDDDDDDGAADECVQTRTWRPWMSMFSPSSQSATAASVIGTVLADAESEGELTSTAAPTHTAPTAITVVVPLLPAVVSEEAAPHTPPAARAADVRGRPDAVRAAADAAAAAAATPDTVLSTAITRDTHTSATVATSEVTVTTTTSTTGAAAAAAAALHTVEEGESFARECIAESAADVREALSAAWTALCERHALLRRRRPLPPPPSPESDAPLVSLPLPFPLSGGAAGVQQTSAMAGISGSGSGSAADTDSAGAVTMPSSASRDALTLVRGSAVPSWSSTTVPSLSVLVVCGGAAAAARPATATALTALGAAASLDSSGSLASPSQASGAAHVALRGVGVSGGPLHHAALPSSSTPWVVDALGTTTTATATRATSAEVSTATAVDVDSDTVAEPSLTISLTPAAAPESHPTRLAALHDDDEESRAPAAAVRLSSPLPTRPAAVSAAAARGSTVHRLSATLQPSASLDAEATRAARHPCSSGSGSGDGLVLSPSPRRSPSLHQRRGPSAGQVVCRWCGAAYTSAAVCPTAGRSHHVLREERRSEKATKRAAQALLREGRVAEAVALLQRAGLYVP